LAVNDDVQLSTEEAENGPELTRTLGTTRTVAQSGIEPRFFGGAVRNPVIMPDELFIPQTNFTPWN
jgi:hypothetical protein